MSQSINESDDGVSHREILANPCYGRIDGFARDLISCKNFVRCINEIPSVESCAKGYVFDAETEMCVDEVLSKKVCFRCSETKQYELISVPNACFQYIQCMDGTPSLRACPNGLVFDGRSGIHQCNVETSPGYCYREDPNEIENQICPPIRHEPVYIVDPYSLSVYYVCWGQKHPIRAECPSGLQFNIDEGVCDYPGNK